MPLPVSVKRDVIFEAAPEHSIWMLNATYVSGDGPAMIVNVHDTDTTGYGVREYENWSGSDQRYLSGDNGQTWHPVGDVRRHAGMKNSPEMCTAWTFCHDRQSDALLGFFMKSVMKPGLQARHGWGHRENRLFYQVSRDGGESWTLPRQVLDRASGCTADEWLPGIVAGEQNLVCDQAPVLSLSDGTILAGLHFADSGGGHFTAFLRGTWDAGVDEFEWSRSNILRVPPSISPVGVCEPDLVQLSDGRVVATMRCQGRKSPPIHSTRQMSVSEDFGKTWSAPRALTYEDGSVVCVPASIARFLTCPKSGRVFWFGNILNHPVCAQSPRYPLTMAEFDPEKLCILRDTVTVIQDLPEGAPPATDLPGGVGRRYSNFAYYVERQTGVFVLLVAEEPKTDWDDGTADCIRFRIEL